MELAGPDRFFCSWVADNYLGAIQEALVRLERPGMGVMFRVDAKENGEGGVDEKARPGQQRLPSIPEVRSRMRTLHPRYTFDEFMVGESNAMAFNACRSIAANSDEAAPCLFINAGTGLGKSHLTHAVAHHLYNHAPDTRLCCLTTQQLTAELVRHLKGNSMEQFKEKFQRHCDLLLVEDVHILSGRVKTQVELAEAVDNLLDSGRRVVFTGTLAPRDIPDLNDGVRSRLGAGLVATINPPDLTTRRLIIRRKAAFHKLELGEEMVEVLAGKIRGDIRQVESAIVGLKAKTSLRKSPPDMAMVREVVAAVAGADSAVLSAEDIRDFVAAQFRVGISDLQSKSRRKEVAFPRQISMYLARKLTDEALSGIGKAFNRDHSTVVHSIRVITDAMARNGSVRGQVELLTQRLRKDQK